ncbi:MAG: Fic family protein [Oscillospiraceae bacterium]|nr:Fic family protein [Oscillospiraceae bacterium]
MINDGNYIEQTEPNNEERSRYWKTAIGLQQVDRLIPSKYLIETAQANIDGEISLSEAELLIASYYKEHPAQTEDEKRSQEADTVSVRIAQALSAKAFSLSPVELTSIHRRLFTGLYDFAGKVRDYNITKKEWVLDDDTVYYGDFRDIRELLEYDINSEKTFSYADLSPRAAAEHIAKFISGLWQIHAFGEGNTRSIAVFTIKYLRAFGYDVTNDAFEKHSLYFRNALVRANYNNHQKGVRATPVYLNRFFGNLLFGDENELKNRALHINFNQVDTKPSSPDKKLDEGIEL